MKRAWSPHEQACRGEKKSAPIVTVNVSLRVANFGGKFLARKLARSRFNLLKRSSEVQIHSGSSPPSMLRKSSRPTRRVAGAGAGSSCRAKARPASSIAPRSASSGFRARGVTRSASAVHVRMAASLSIRSGWCWQNGPTPICCIFRRAGQALCPASEPRIGKTLFAQVMEFVPWT